MEGSLFCFVVMRSTELVCFRLCFLVSLESSQWGVHGLGSMTFGLVEQKFLNIENVVTLEGLPFNSSMISFHIWLFKKSIHTLQNNVHYFIMGSHLGQQHRLLYWELIVNNSKGLQALSFSFNAIQGELHPRGQIFCTLVGGWFSFVETLKKICTRNDLWTINFLIYKTF